jgi:hypothetical protein
MYVKLWNIEVLSNVSRMGIKMWEVCFLRFFCRNILKDESDWFILIHTLCTGTNIAQIAAERGWKCGIAAEHGWKCGI